MLFKNFHGVTIQPGNGLILRSFSFFTIKVMRKYYKTSKYRKFPPCSFEEKK